MAAANQSVVDELVVKLTLDASAYQKADKVIVQLVDATESKMKDVDKKRTDRDRKQIKRNQDNLKSVKELAAGFKTLAVTIGAMLGIGSAAGLVGAVVALANMETGLRRAAVSTGLSNRELQAYSSTMRRLGADAQGGAQAIADLAREQKQFNITGQAPTMQAFARMGVRVTPASNVTDVLAQAQQLYRQATPAQKGQIESGLAAQGVSADLIVAIKSEKDVREEFAHSYQESAEENRKALDAVTDGLTALGNAATNVANSIATVLQPYIEQFSQFVSQGAQQVSAFVDRVMAAGGGVDGFLQVLNEDSPQLAALLKDLQTGLTVFAQAIDLATYGLKLIGEGLHGLYDWLDNKLSILGGGGGKTHPLKDAVSTVGDAIKWAWNSSLQDARTEGVTHLSTVASGVKLSSGAAARIAGGALSGGPAAPAGGAVQGIMATLVSKYGLTPAQAAAVAANAQAESRGNPAANNPAGGGTGARGLFQWRGARTAEFQKRYGVTPDKGTVEQQLDFLMTDPYERSLLDKSFSGGGSAAALGERFSRIFEAHGNVAEDVRRGSAAAQLQTQFGGGTGGAGVGQQINIQSMTVQANTPQEFVGGITRQSGVQSYNSAVR